MEVSSSSVINFNKRATEGIGQFLVISLNIRNIARYFGNLIVVIQIKHIKLNQLPETSILRRLSFMIMRNIICTIINDV